MGMKNILVHLDNSSATVDRLDLAVRLARKHNAHLCGLYVISHQYYQPRHISEQNSLESMESLFTRKCAEAGISSQWSAIDWTVIGVSLTEIVNMRAYYSDLVIVGQTDFNGPNRSLAPEMPERLVLASGRPVLIVPYAGTFEHIGDRIMIAWKAGREATRAVNDAMPCLKLANHVSVVGVSSGSTELVDTDAVFAEVRNHLGRHGVTAETELISAGNFPIGDMLLNRASDNTIDMLVMGAYAHTRRGTLDLSPVARHVLKHMTVPVLMSH